MELRFASSGAEAVLPQKALGWLVGVGMRGLLVDVESNHFFLSFFVNFLSFQQSIFLSQCFSLISLFLWCLPIAAYVGSALRRGYCHEPCTATAHGCPTLLPMDLFEAMIECTATDHVIFS